MINLTPRSAMDAKSDGHLVGEVKEKLFHQVIKGSESKGVFFLSLNEGGLNEDCRQSH